MERNIFQPASFYFEQDDIADIVNNEIMTKWERNKIKGMRKEAKSRERKIVSQILKECNVTLATCIGSQFHALNGKMFDLVIIDEAAQALEAACWIPALKVSLRTHLLTFNFTT